jgi:hypothetical protein
MKKLLYDLLYQATEYISCLLVIQTLIYTVYFFAEGKHFMPNDLMIEPYGHNIKHMNQFTTYQVKCNHEVNTYLCVAPHGVLYYIEVEPQLLE